MRSLPLIQNAGRGSVASERRALRRTTVGQPQQGRLYFAQVREDPLLEIEALAPGAGGRHLVVSSGGCTLLSLLGAGADEVVGVDLNTTQNHLVELKAAACHLGGEEAVAFLGGWPSHPWARDATYLRLRDRLSPSARAHWERRRRAIRAGVLRTGVTEKFLAAIAALVRRVVHPPARIQALLACASLEEQRRYFAGVWNSRRWRWLFQLLCNRWVMSRTYHPAFFQHVANPSFAEHFLGRAAHALTELPVGTNYFLHQLLTGHYPAEARALPPYLTPQGTAAVAAGRERLSLVDGSLLDLLRAEPPAAFDGFALSNIAEWLAPAEQRALFTEVVRTARPGARLVYRNFVGWTEIPPDLRPHLEVDEALGDRLSGRDRSLVQRRIVVATVRKGPVRS